MNRSGYGAQEGARQGYNPRQPGRPRHQPLQAGLGSGYVVNLWNRRGDTHTAHQAIACYEQTRRELPRNLRMRWTLADSGFGEEGLLEHWEGQGDPYIVALPLTRYVQRASRAVRDWKEWEAGVEVAEAGGKQPMLFKELAEPRDYRYSVLVSNDTVLAPEDIWRTYRPRAKEENAIKELQEGYGRHEFKVHSFWGTEAAMLLIGMVCYNLVHHLNRCVLKTAAGGVARLKTLRLKLLAIPAVYGSGAGRPTLRLGVQDRSLRARMRYWLHRINALELRLFNCNALAKMVTVEP